MKFEDAVGKWCLVTTKLSWFSEPRQAMILELSPSKEYVRYRFAREDFSKWVSVNHLTLVEILYDAKL